MSLNKKEKTMLIVLVIMAYAFAFVKVVVINAVPKVKEAQQRLVDIKQQKAALEAEYLSLQAYKDDIAAKKVVDDRLGSYLMNNAGLTDSILFIEKLALLFDTSLKKISLGAPQTLSVNESKYFGFPVKFEASLAYDDFRKIIEYCEGGSKKVRVDSYDFKPSSDDDIYDVTMKLVFYSIDKESADRLFQFSHSSFQQYRDREGEPIYVSVNEEPDFEKASISIGKSAGITKSNADLIVVNQGYLYGGYNFETYSSFNSGDRIRKTTTEKMDVFITLTNTGYTIETTDSYGKKEQVTGNIPDRELTFFIESNVITEVEENRNIQVNIRVQNDSGKNIRTKIRQTGNRVKLMDRNGNEITLKSDGEKVYIE
jgi:hypothetical protein